MKKFIKISSRYDDEDVKKEKVQANKEIAIAYYNNLPRLAAVISVGVIIGLIVVGFIIFIGRG